ncbi:alpha/beta-hydrolase [Mycena pura]|uniref:feruloyl esterase n=1 Tax=Mycena pura TaxID=153505 RepID=A0AAD6Y2U6_9AGAR|nr:alpha/beta-hydrolase [Mycena pura]
MLSKSRFILLASSGVFACAVECNSTSSWTFDSSNHSNQTIGDRSFLVHIPAQYNADTPHPVVLSFHGYGMDDRTQEHITGFSKDGLFIDGKGIIAVYPLAAYGPGWNQKPVRAWIGAPYSPQGVDDFGFVDSLLDALQNSLCVDPKRIYASGMSNGGGFVNLLACTAASRFAAFAPVSPALYNGTHPFSDCAPGRVVPLITFHGTADRTIPYTGRKASAKASADDTPPIAEWCDSWVVRNGCDASAPSNVTAPYAGVNETTWQCGASNDTAVKAFVIENGTHHWPTTAETSFDATSEQIVPFFNQYMLD